MRLRMRVHSRSRACVRLCMHAFVHAHLCDAELTCIQVQVLRASAGKQQEARR